jgi:uncharacterized membrane protein
MNNSTMDKRSPVSQRVYGLLLLAYPLEFRREYGPHMAQVFRDCERRERKLQRVAGLPRLWLHVLADLSKTAPKERLQNFGKGVSIVRALRNMVIAIVIYALAFIVTGEVLARARQHLPFAVGSFIDALVSVGILFNFIVLVLVTTRAMSAARAVLTSVIVTVVLLGVGLSLIAMRVPAEARPGGLTILMLGLSLLIWFVIHWMWAQRKTSSPAAT